jgi:hypothetical protein
MFADVCVVVIFIFIIYYFCFVLPDKVSRRSMKKEGVIELRIKVSLPFANFGVENQNELPPAVT